MPREPRPVRPRAGRRQARASRIAALGSAELARRIDTAVNRRAGLTDSAATDAVRLVHDAADGAAGLVIERWRDVLVVQVHEDRFSSPLDALREVLRERFDAWNVRAAYLKRFVRDRAHADASTERLHRDPQPWIGESVEPAITIRECGARFLVRPYDGFSVGLFLEQRDRRRRVRELACDRRVLNLFCYSGGFTVAAALGGSPGVTSVDLSRRYLAWCRENLVANGLAVEPHRFYASDVFEFLRRAERQSLRFDLIVIDPPTFARMRRPKRVFRFADDLERLAAGALRILEPDGLLLCSTNDRTMTHERIERAFRDAAAPRRCEVVDRPPLPPDFAGDPDYSKSVLLRVK